MFLRGRVCRVVLGIFKPKQLTGKGPPSPSLRERKMQYGEMGLAVLLRKSILRGSIQATFTRR